MTESLSGETRLFPIIGDPVKHAKSPQRMISGFRDRGCNAICIPIEVTKEDLGPVMEGLSLTRNVDGLLVTMPHKFTAFNYCRSSSERAKLLKAVSAMRRNQDGSWHGDTLDGLAFVKAQVDEGARPEGARVLLVGAGAAGSAIAIALLEANVRELIVHDSDKARATQLVDLLSDLGRGRVTVGSPDPTDCDMVCNATPMGMSADDPLPIDTNLLTPSMFVGDVIAGHGETALLKAANAKGCRTANGVQMVDAVQEMMLDFLLGN